MKIAAFVKRLLKDESGPTAVEYAIMLALILAVILASVGLVGTEANALYENIGSEMDEAMNNAS